MRSIVSLAFLLVASPALSHTVLYDIVLNGPSESPPNPSLGVGTGLVTFDFDLVTMRVEAEFSGLTGNTTASHIHCCTVDPGVLNAGVATVTPTFTGFPLGVKSGTYDHTYDMSLASSYNAAFITANGGSVSTALDALIAGFDSGRAYLNIHTSTSGAGEIRGFLTRIPEPTTTTLVVLGLAAVTGMRSRRRIC